MKDAAVVVCWYAPLKTCWKGCGNHHYWDLSAACSLFCEKAAVLKVAEKLPRYGRKFAARLKQIQHLVAHVHCRKWSPHMFSATDCNNCICATLVDQQLLRWQWGRGASQQHCCSEWQQGTAGKQRPGRVRPGCREAAIREQWWNEDSEQRTKAK